MVAQKLNDFLDYVTSIIMEAHPLEIISNLLAYFYLSVHIGETQACLDDSATVSVGGQLDGIVDQLLIEHVHKVSVIVSNDVGKNNLYDIIAVLIVAEFNEFTVLEG